MSNSAYNEIRLKTPRAELPVQTIKRFAIDLYGIVSHSDNSRQKGLNPVLAEMLKFAETKIPSYKSEKFWGQVRTQEEQNQIRECFHKDSVFPLYGPCKNGSEKLSYFDEVRRVCHTHNSLARQYKRFAIYCICNNLDPCRELQKLNDDNPHLRNALPENFSLDLGTVFYNPLKNCRIGDGGKYIIGNSDFFSTDTELLPVFIVEEQTVAEKTEVSIQQDEINYIKNRLKSVYNVPQKDIDALKLHYQCDRVLGKAICVAPQGGYQIPFCNDWSQLNNRDVYIFSCQKPIERVYKELLDVAAAIIGDTDNAMAHRIFIVVLETGTTDVSDVLCFHLAEFVKEAIHSGETLPQVLQKIYDDTLREELKPDDRYIVEPFLTKKSWAMITGEEGCGKTWAGLGIAAAIASKGKLFLGMKVKRRARKVLYLADDEMDQYTLHDREKVFCKIYPKAKANLIIKRVSDYDLTLCENGKYPYRDKILQLIESFSQGAAEAPVEVLVIDQLLKFSNMQGSEAGYWKDIRRWMNTLCREKGISIILLHHEYGGSRMRGSRDIAADSPSRISLKKGKRDGDKDTIHLKISLYKNRSGYESDFHEIDLPLKAPRWVDRSQQNFSSGQTFKDVKDEMERMELLKTYRNKGMKNREIADILQCSVSTLNIYIKRLPSSEKRK